MVLLCYHNLATESMQVEHGSQVSVQKIMQAVKNAGYAATLSNTLDQAEFEAKQAQTKARLLHKKRTTILVKLRLAGSD